MHLIQRFTSSWRELKNLRTLVLGGLFLALSVVLSRFAWNVSPSIKVTFSYLAVACTGMLFGPVMGGIIGALSDVLAAMLFPTGAYVPLFTLTALVNGVIYGLALYKCDFKIWHIALARALVVIIGSLLLNTLFITFIGGDAFWVLLPARAIKSVAQYPVDLVIMSFVLMIVKRAYKPIG